MRIVDVRPATSDEWDVAAAGDKNATFFHSRQWSLIWQGYEETRLEPAGLTVSFSDGRSAVIALSVRRRFRRTTAISSPAGTYGGWITEAPITPTHALALAHLLQTRFPNLTWRLNPFDPVTSRINIRDARSDFTQALDLRPGISALFETWSKGCRSSTKKALRSGIRFRVANTEEDWRSYFHLYLESIDRWSNPTSRYEWPLFSAISRLDSQHARLWVADADGVIAAGAICFYWNRHIVYWHGSSTRTLAHLSPTNGLLFNVISDGSRAGYEIFDFNPSGGHQGVIAFKKGFGTTTMESRVLQQRTRTTRSLALLRGYFHAALSTGRSV